MSRTPSAREILVSCAAHARSYIGLASHQNPCENRHQFTCLISWTRQMRTVFADVRASGPSGTGRMRAGSDCSSESLRSSDPCNPKTRDLPMRFLSIVAALMSIGVINTACAQTATTSGMGATSPLGSAAQTSAPLANIPMSATELDQAGISPLATPCPTTSSNGSFDGGGVATSTACGSASTTTSSGMGATDSGLGGSDASASGAGVTTGSNTGIPLGATGLGTPGESKGAAIATAPVTTCTSTQDPTNSTATAGTVSPGSC